MVDTVKTSQPRNKSHSIQEQAISTGVWDVVMEVDTDGSVCLDLPIFYLALTSIIGRLSGDSGAYSSSHGSSVYLVWIAGIVFITTEKKQSVMCARAIIVQA